MQEEQHKLSPGSRIVSFTLLGSDQRGLWDWYPRDTVEGALWEYRVPGLLLCAVSSLYT